MQLIDSFRKAVQAAAESELLRRQARQTASQNRLAGKESDFVALPVDPRGWRQLQDLTPGSSTLGKFLY